MQDKQASGFRLKTRLMQDKKTRLLKKLHATDKKMHGTVTGGNSTPPHLRPRPPHDHLKNLSPNIRSPIHLRFAVSSNMSRRYHTIQKFVIVSLHYPITPASPVNFSDSLQQICSCTRLLRHPRRLPAREAAPPSSVTPSLPQEAHSDRR